VRLEAVERRTDHDSVRLTGAVQRADGSRCEIYFAYDAAHAPLVSGLPDAFVPALRRSGRRPLEFAQEISPPAPAPPVCRRLLGLVPHLRPSRSTRAHGRHHACARNSVGAFFSGEASTPSYAPQSLRGWPRGIRHLLYFHGLRPLRRGVAPGVGGARCPSRWRRSAASWEDEPRTHFPLVWGEYCGAGLASAALSLSGGFGEVLVPSTDAYADALPWGSHPLVDELWSTERTTVLPDGAEATRAAKLERLVAHDPLARRHLRVCLVNAGGDFNCGRCSKCVRTRLTLYALGVGTRSRPSHALPEDPPAAMGLDHRIYWSRTSRSSNEPGAPVRRGSA
jgi:hypothetical protein